MARSKKRHHGEGSVIRLPDGRWRAVLSLGYDEATGKRVRKVFEGKTKSEALQKLLRFKERAARGIPEPASLPLEVFLKRWAG